MDPRPTPASELVQVNLTLPDLPQATAQAEIVKAVEAQPGVQRIEIIGDSLHVLYDPVQVTEHEIERLLQRSGHPAKDADVHRDTPFDG